MTMYRWAPGLLVIFLVGLSAAARADTIHLKNGDVIEGKILTQDDKKVVIQIGALGKMTFTMDRVEKIVKDDKVGGNQGGVIKGRKRDPVPPKKTEPKKVDPKESPKGPAKDCPYIDRSKIDPVADQRARSQIRRLTAKARFRNRGRNQLRNLGEKAGRPLVQALSNPSPVIRREAATLLGEIGYKPAVPKLIRGSLRDKDGTVREAGIQALRKLTQKNFRYFSNAVPRLREMALKKWDAWWAAEAKRYGLKGKPSVDKRPKPPG